VYEIISGTAEEIGSKFIWKVFRPSADGFEGRGQRSKVKVTSLVQKNGIFGPYGGL